MSDTTVTATATVPTAQPTTTTTVTSPIDRSFTQIAKLFLSRKLFMCLIATIVLYFSYWDMIKYLFAFTQPAQIAAFQSISTNFFWSISTVWLFYIGVQGATTWGNSTSSSVSQAVQTINEKIDSTNTEIRVDPKDVEGADDVE